MHPKDCLSTENNISLACKTFPKSNEAKTLVGGVRGNRKEILNSTLVDF